LGEAEDAFKRRQKTGTATSSQLREAIPPPLVLSEAK
jgi:hypothetical protein